MLQIIVKREEKTFQQDYICGIAQHELYIYNLEGSLGTEIILRPDISIFGNKDFSSEILDEWIKQKIRD